ncbi:tyrosine-protein phosphatase non-receptor type substrate 1-like [Pseudophryne corroboree]|uniref:tyrosine-protein phosphatase non-receptor type substrate 1-like n=1 Tax=Pseudophryne corroboree TaxID=495146 RepID=UPI003081865A
MKREVQEQSILSLLERVMLGVSPLVSQLILPELNAAGEKMVIICNISGFRPKAINIHWYIDKPRREPESDLSENEPLLQPVEVTSQAQHPVTKHGNVFNVTSQLSFTPCILDDGAMLVCEVQHRALQSVTRRECPIHVVARPKRSYITSWPQVPQAGKPLTLTCIVEKFYPKMITITWLKNGQSLTNIIPLGPFPCENDYYTAWSQTDFLLTEDDDGAIFTCQISHSSLGKIEELSYEINLKGTPPEVQFISADPPIPTKGESMRLSCMINNFFPAEIRVIWFKNGIRLEAGIYDSQCVTSNIGLHSMCSILKFSPQNEDDESVFTCTVQHIALKYGEERFYTLRLPWITDLITSVDYVID